MKTTGRDLLFQGSLVGAFSLLVHFWLVLASQIFSEAIPFGDLSLYNYWVFMAENGGGVYGLQVDWIYPALAFVPMLLASVISSENFELGWLAMVFALNTAAALLLIRTNEKAGPLRPIAAPLVFLGGLVLLGPVSISRIDSVSASLAVFALVAISRGANRAAAVVFTIAAWIKIWPLAMFLALVASFRERMRALVAGFSISASIVIVGIALGGTAVFSFVFQQQGRGIQIESVYATLWLWLAKFGLAEIYFDDQVLTNQVLGPGVVEVSSISNLLLFAALTLTFVFARRAISLGRDSNEVFVLASLAGVLDLIVFNKVGSPQFMIWILIPLVAAFYFELRYLSVPITLAALVLLLTQLVYPIFYIELLGLELGPLILITLRNLLIVALLVWGNLRLLSQKSL